MNPFKKCKPILNSDEVVRISFSKAMKPSVKGDSIHVPALLRNRRKEARRIEFCAQQINKHLKESVYNFPSLKPPATHQFYIDSVKQSSEIGNLKRKLGAINKSTEIIWRINKEHVSEIWNTTSVRTLKRIRRKAFARYASVVSIHKDRLKLLEKPYTKVR